MNTGNAIEPEHREITVRMRPQARWQLDGPAQNVTFVDRLDGCGWRSPQGTPVPADLQAVLEAGYAAVADDHTGEAKGHDLLRIVQSCRMLTTQAVRVLADEVSEMACDAAFSEVEMSPKKFETGVW